MVNWLLAGKTRDKNRNRLRKIMNSRMRHYHSNNIMGYFHYVKKNTVMEQYNYNNIFNTNINDEKTTSNYTN